MLRQLAGTETRSPHWPLEDGRLPLYVCCMCADLACGALTVHVAHQGEQVVWSDVRFENGLRESAKAKSLVLMVFDRVTYADLFTSAILAMEELAADDESLLSRRRHWRQRRR